MAEADLKHRLAAILAADAAGYSRLMGIDERGTLAALDSARAVFQKHVQSNRGVVIDTAGDSILAVFELATGAVAASLAIQEELRLGMETVPEDRRMRFRIGVHIGEVIEKADGSVYGDGVNIAARLQAKAPPGATCVSQMIYDTVSRKVPMQARFIGAESFKNIREAVPVWLVWPEGVPEPETATPAAKRAKSAFDGRIASALAALVIGLALGTGWYATRQGSGGGSTASISASDSKSIAILPFANMSDDKDTAYFADGVHEDLLTQLALLGELKVVSRTSVMEYRDTKKNMRQIGTELGVGSLLEGSVRRAGNKVRVSAQLIDSATDKHLWAKSYDRELKDIFAIQSELATEIAKALKVTLAPDERARLNAKPTEDLEAFDLYLRYQAVHARDRGSIRWINSTKERIALLTKTVERDPKFAVAWAYLAKEYSTLHSLHLDREAAPDAKAGHALARAQSLAPDDPIVMIADGKHSEDVKNDDERAATIYERVLQRAPNHLDALLRLSAVRGKQRRDREWADLGERVLAIDPRNASALLGLSNAYRNYRHYDRALVLQKQLINLRPDDLDLIAKYHLIEYWRTGSWSSYDSWRSTLPQGVELKIARIRNVDADRALARRDFKEVLRLTDADTDDTRAMIDGRDPGYKGALRAMIYRAMGDEERAALEARAALQVFDAYIGRDANDESLHFEKARMHALLGERDRALAVHAQAIEVARRNNGLRGEEYAKRDILRIHALLGDKGPTLIELSRQLKLPSSWAHDFRVMLELAPLWDDAEFQSIISDTANNAPLPL